MRALQIKHTRANGPMNFEEAETHLDYIRKLHPATCETVQTPPHPPLSLSGLVSGKGKFGKPALLFPQLILEGGNVPPERGRFQEGVDSR